MLKIALVTFLTLAASAFASTPELDTLMGTLEGHGQWKSTDGSKGTWTSVLTVEKAEKGAKMKEVLTIHTPDQKDHVEEMSWDLIKKEHGFFDIAIEGKLAGWGHCFGHICQINSAGREPGSRWAETIKVTKHGLVRFGTEHSDKFQVSWHGISKKK